MTKERKILNFRVIKVTIPRKFILKCLGKRYYTTQEQSKIRHKIKALEETIFKAQHALSVVERVRIRFENTNNNVAEG